MGYKWVTSGLLVGMSGLRVGYGLQVGDKWVTSGLQVGYEWVTSGLWVGYEWHTSGL